MEESVKFERLWEVDKRFSLYWYQNNEARFSFPTYDYFYLHHFQKNHDDKHKNKVPLSTTNRQAETKATPFTKSRIFLSYAITAQRDASTVSRVIAQTEVFNTTMCTVYMNYKLYFQNLDSSVIILIGATRKCFSNINTHPRNKLSFKV